MNHYKSKQSGMTLIELAVVLLILVGLAGLLIPYVSSFVGKTHTSTGAATIQGVNTAVIRFSGEGFSGNTIPDGFDSVTDGAGALLGIMGGGQYQATALTADGLAALNDAGISTVFDGVAGDATFGAKTARTLVATENIVELSAAGITNLEATLGIDASDATKAYVIMGVGNNSEMNGKTMAEAPVHFHEDGSMDYGMMYSRYLAVIEVDDVTLNSIANATATSSARFIGTVGPMMAIAGAGDHINEYREIIADEQ